MLWIAGLKLPNLRVGFGELKIINIVECAQDGLLGRRIVQYLRPASQRYTEQSDKRKPFFQKRLQGYQNNVV